MIQRMQKYTLERKSIRMNELNEQIAEWKPAGSIWAAISVANGSVSELNQILRIDSTHTAVTRDSVQTGDRFGGFRVTYVVQGRRFNTLYLKRDDALETAVEK